MFDKDANLAHLRRDKNPTFDRNVALFAVKVAPLAENCATY